ncbi:hypothetical protein TeGR_g5154 [Tetraparma gracilis]|uniref:Actin maturation protease n=1 Tax=Tetraparma gracilis TaxID=2962635 RepID=A0ABQ6MR12_9STRA|nr:hypothetical protein TeGR_g5154 [Tetraparma gracilis]
MSALPPAPLQLVRLNPREDERIGAAKLIARSAFNIESVDFQLAPASQKGLVLNTSFVLLEADVVVGYACLKPHHGPKADGHRNEAILHSLCIDESKRGRGYGTFLANTLCTHAKNEMGINFVLLTPEKKNEAALIRLYSRCGFVQMGEGEDVTNMGSALSERLERTSTDVGKLSDLFRTRGRVQENSQPGAGGGVWMRRRMRDRSELQDRKWVGEPEFRRAVETCKKVGVWGSGGAGGGSWEFVGPGTEASVYGLRWEPQLGPMCGLAALYIALGMVADTPEINLLQLAQSLNFTKDGEMFCAEDMAQLCGRSGLRAELRSLDELRRDPNLLPAAIDASGCWLVAFDLVGNRVGERGGASAHWGLVTGYAEKRGAGEFAVTRRAEGGEMKERERGDIVLYIQHSQNEQPIFVGAEELFSSNQLIGAPNRKYAHVAERMGLSGTIIRLQAK